MTVEFKAGDLTGALTDVLVKLGAGSADARMVAEMYVTAELYDLPSHGIMRFLRIIDGIRAGTHVPGNSPMIEKEGPSFALLNGNQALGVPVADTAMRMAVEKAGRTGIGCVGVRNSNHFGIAGHYARTAARSGMIGMAFCNTQPGIAPPGGKGKILGTNPIAIGVPTREHPLVLDMSLSAVSRGHVLEAARRGRPIETGIALDKAGRPTTDPHSALEGALLPFGGQSAYKAFGLALMIDVLCGPLVGAAFGDRVTGTADTRRPCTKGDFFIAVDISRFRPLEDFLEDVEELKAIVKRSGDAVLLPGEPEERSRTAAGEKVVLDDEIAAALLEVGRDAGIVIEGHVGESV